MYKINLFSGSLTRLRDNTTAKVSRWKLIIAIIKDNMNSGGSRYYFG